jgi:amino acid transporter
VAAIWFTSALSVAAALYSPAFAALSAGTAVFFYISYAMPIAAGLFAEGKTWREFGPFRLGWFSKPFAMITMLGVLVLTYAGLQPPSEVLVRYSIGIAILLVAVWFGAERRRFAGPPTGESIARKQGEIERSEQELAR